VVIHKKVVIDILSGRVIEDEKFVYDGPIAKLKGGNPSSTTTTNTALPGWLQPYAQQFIGAYQGQVFDPNGQMKQQNIPQQGVAGFTPDQIASMDQIRSMAGPAQQLALQGANQLGDTMSGKYLDPNSNPYLQNTYELASRQMGQQFQNSIMPGLTAAAQRAGQFGSSSMNEAMGGAMNTYNQGLTDLATQIYGGNYQQERSRQMQANQLLPSSMQSLYQPGMALGAIGAQQQAQNQAQMDTGYQNQVAQFELPYNLLSGFGGALGQSGMGAGTSTTRATGSSGGK